MITKERTLSMERDCDWVALIWVDSELDMGCSMHGSIRFRGHYVATGTKAIQNRIKCNENWKEIYLQVVLVPLQTPRLSCKVASLEVVLVLMDSLNDAFLHEIHNSVLPPYVVLDVLDIIAQTETHFMEL